MHIITKLVKVSHRIITWWLNSPSLSVPNTIQLTTETMRNSHKSYSVTIALESHQHRSSILSQNNRGGPERHPLLWIWYTTMAVPNEPNSIKLEVGTGKYLDIEFPFVRYQIRYSSPYPQSVLLTCHSCSCVASSHYFGTGMLHAKHLHIIKTKRPTPSLIERCPSPRCHRPGSGSHRCPTIFYSRHNCDHYVRRSY